MLTINTVEAIEQLRLRLHDRAGRTWDDAEILGALDASFRQVFTVMRTHGQSVGLDTEVVDLSSMTTVEPNVLQYDLPEHIADIQLIELVSATEKPTPIPQMQLEEKDVASSWQFSRDARGWHFGPRESIHIRGSVGGWSQVRIWFVRGVPPMIYGNPASGSTSTAVLNTATGAYKKRDGIYAGMRFEVVSGTNAGQVRRCTSFVGGTLTFSPVFSSPIDTTSRLALLIPVPGEYVEYLTMLAVWKLMSRRGSEEDKAEILAELQQLQMSFESGISRPSSGEPPRVVSSRRLGR